LEITRNLWAGEIATNTQNWADLLTNKAGKVGKICGFVSGSPCFRAISRNQGGIYYGAVLCSLVGFSEFQLHYSFNIISVQVSIAACLLPCTSSINRPKTLLIVGSIGIDSDLYSCLVFAFYEFRSLRFHKMVNLDLGRTGKLFALNFRLNAYVFSLILYLGPCDVGHVG